MEIPKSLLAAIIVGLSVNMTSCDKPDNHDLKNCTEENCPDDSGHDDVDCPACGMG